MILPALVFPDQTHVFSNMTRCGCGRVAEHSPNHPMVNGSSPAEAGEKNVNK
jgi:hypothetical protein